MACGFAGALVFTHLDLLLSLTLGTVQSWGVFGELSSAGTPSSCLAKATSLSATCPSLLELDWGVGSAVVVDWLRVNRRKGRKCSVTRNSGVTSALQVIFAFQVLVSAQNVSCEALTGFLRDLAECGICCCMESRSLDERRSAPGNLADSESFELMFGGPQSPKGKMNRADGAQHFAS